MKIRSLLSLAALGAVIAAAACSSKNNSAADSAAAAAATMGDTAAMGGGAMGTAPMTDSSGAMMADSTAARDTTKKY